MKRSHCLTSLGIAITMLLPGRVTADDPATMIALQQYPAAQKVFARRMFLASTELTRFRLANLDAHLIVGRVQLEGKDDPETAQSQMLIGEEGFFVEVISDVRVPVEFRRHQYKPLNFVIPKEKIPDVDTVIDVGVVQMQRASSSQRGTVTEILKLEGGGDPSKTSVVLNIRTNPRPNTPSGGTEGIDRKHKRIPGKVKEDGTMTFESLSEGDYYAEFRKEGFIKTIRPMTVFEGQNTAIGVLLLEQPRKIKLEYVNARDPAKTFVAAEKKTTSFAAGHRWKSRPEIYAWDLKFTQVGVQLAPPTMFDDGSGPGTSR